MRAVICAAAVLWLSALSPSTPAAAAQSASDGQGAARITLRGQLVDATRGGPLPRARVTLTSGRTTLATVSTDGEGRFTAAVPPAAPLSLRVVKAGYASMTLRVSPEQIRGPDPLRIEAPRGAAIAGRAVDSFGEPATIVVIRRVASEGRAWSPTSLDAAPLLDDLSTIRPDERGEFRVGGLVPGRYVIDAYPSAMLYQIQANPSSGLVIRAMTSPIEVSSAPIPVSSFTVDVAAGSEASGVSLLVERMPPAAPAPHPAGSTIRGTVSTMDGAPVADATVTAGRNPVDARSARTDTFGRFTLRGIAPGRVTLRAAKRGYAASQPGQRGADLPGHEVTIEPGKDIDDVAIVLPRLGAISGIVVDEHGEPLQEVTVQLFRVKRQPTGALVGIREPGNYIRRSDDRGQFRLSELVPGEYAVMAMPSAETTDPEAAIRFADVPAYYPDTPDFASAAAIRIVDGEVVPGLVLTMRRMPVARVTGVALTSRGLPVDGTVRLMSRHAINPGELPRAVRPGPAGEFVFPDVAPGDYILRTSVESGPSAREAATSYVTVANRDPEPVTVRTSGGASLSGRIVLDGGAGRVLWGFSAGGLALDPASSAVSVTTVTSAVSTGESFTVSGLAGATRVRVWSDDRNWYVKSILIDGFDVVDIPFDFGSDARVYSDVAVVFSRGATIAGAVTDERAAPVRDYAVYVFATDRDTWFAGSRWVKRARAAADGRFEIASLPPGDYWVAAVDRMDTSGTPGFQDGSLSANDGNWVDAELLTMLSSRAARVALGEGQEQTVSLRLIRR